MGGAANDAKLIGSCVGGKYRLVRLIGHGGMGSVFEAVHTEIGKHLAIKLLAPEHARDRASNLRFQREAQAASAAESAHIVQVFDVGTSDDGRPYLVMELLRGEDLRARLRRYGKLPVADAVEILRQVLRALVSAHAARIVHRDLKPDNVFISSRDDQPNFVRIVDFGVSKITGGKRPDTLTRRGTILGTVLYMSPEQAQGLDDIDGRADLYSAGAILFEALTGRPPHLAPTHEALLVSICTKAAPDVRSLRPDVPAPLARVVTRALERDRSQRFQSAREFADALETASDAGAEASAPPPAADLSLPLRRRPLALWAAALLGCAALLGWLLRPGPDAADTVDPAAAAGGMAPPAVSHPPALLARVPPPALVQPVPDAGEAHQPGRQSRPPPRAKPAVEPRGAPERRPQRAAPKQPDPASSRNSRGVASGLRLDMTEP